MTVKIKIYKYINKSIKSLTEHNKDNLNEKSY